MKTLLLEILLGLTLPAAIFHTQISNIFSSEKSVNKQVSFSIARDSNYDGKVYDMAVATVHVQIFKVKDHKQTILWDRVFDTMQLKKYPTMPNAMHQTVTVKNILEGKEKLFVTYTITYNSKGSIMQLENGTSVANGEKESKLFISL